MVDSGYKNWCWQVKQLLVNTVQAPTLFSLDISNEFSVNTALAFIKNELIDLAERIWLEGLHRPVTNSESGGKLCNYKLIKSCSDTAGFVLAPCTRPWPEMGGGFAACWVPPTGGGDW